MASSPLSSTPGQSMPIEDHVAQTQSCRRHKLRFPQPDADAMAAVLPPPLPHHAAAKQEHDDDAARFTALLLQSPAYAGSLRSVVVLTGSRFLRPAQQLLGEVCAALLPESAAVEVATATVGSSPSPSPLSLIGSDGTDVVSLLLAVDAEGLARHGREVVREEKAKLLHMQGEVCERYKQYHQQMEMVVSSFESVPGLSCAAPYASLAVKVISSHFGRIRSMTSRQMQYISKLLAQELLSLPDSSSGDKAMAITEKREQPAAAAALKLPRGHPHPERAVSVLRAWLFNNFLHPYPTDEEKEMLATRTGLSLNQVSNWFSNARHRLWMPMVEELHNLHTTTLPAAGSTGNCTPSHSGVAMSSSHAANAALPGTRGCTDGSSPRGCWWRPGPGMGDDQLWCCSWTWEVSARCR